MTQQQMDRFDEFFIAWLQGVHRETIMETFKLSEYEYSGFTNGLRKFGILTDEMKEIRNTNIKLKVQNQRIKTLDEFFESGLSPIEFSKSKGYAGSYIRCLARDVGENIRKYGTSWKLGEITQDEYNHIRKVGNEQIADLVWKVANEHATLQSVATERGCTRELMRQQANYGARYIRDYRYRNANPEERNHDDVLCTVSRRAENVLRRLGATTEEEIIKLTPDIIYNAPSCGEKCFKEIVNLQNRLKEERNG